MSKKDLIEMVSKQREEIYDIGVKMGRTCMAKELIPYIGNLDKALKELIGFMAREAKNE